MKKIKLIHICITLLSMLFVAMTLLLFGGCTEYDMGDNTDTKEAYIRINVTTHDASLTRAGGETAINNAIVLVYNASQVFEKSNNLGNNNSIMFTLREGKKFIFVVANPGSALRTKLEASPTYTDLVNMLSETTDYNAGNLPSQGLLMSGQAEKTISSGTTNTVDVKLTFCIARIDLYIKKGSSDVDNIALSSVKLAGARGRGYLFKDDWYATAVTNTVSLINNKIETFSATGDGLHIGTQYCYPLSKDKNTAFTLTLKHANASADDTYTVYLNDDNSSASGSTLERGKQYKVIVTFAKDEQGNLGVSAYTKQIDNNFVIG